jgi:hypothetical protein
LQLSFQKLVQNDTIANAFTHTISNSHYIPIEIPTYYPRSNDLTWNDDDFWINIFDNSALISAALSTSSLAWQTGKSSIKLWQLHQSLSPFASSKTSFLNASLPELDSSSQLWKVLESLGDLKPFEKAPEFLHSLSNSVYSFYDIQGTKSDKLKLKCNNVVMQGLDILSPKMSSKKGIPQFAEKLSQYLSYRLPEYSMSPVPKSSQANIYGHGIHLIPPFPGVRQKSTPVVENSKEEIKDDSQPKEKEQQEVKITRAFVEPKVVPHLAQLFTPSETQIYFKNIRANMESAFNKNTWNSAAKDLLWEDIMEQFLTTEEDYQQ